MRWCGFRRVVGVCYMLCTTHQWCVLFMPGCLSQPMVLGATPTNLILITWRAHAAAAAGSGGARRRGASNVAARAG